MKIGEWVRNNVDNARDLVGSGIEGANTGWHQAAEEEPVAALLTRAAQNSWKAAAAGAIIGSIGFYASDDRKRTKSAVVGGFVGAFLGMGYGVAWNARHALGGAATGAVKNINVTRDQHWLERHPVTYA